MRPTPVTAIGIYSALALVARGLPTVDISADTARQVILAAGTTNLYQGHVTTALMPDGKTMFAVWTINHGGYCGPAAKSMDGGLTWQRIDDLLPKDYQTKHRNCPTLQRIIAPDGKARLMIFSNTGGGVGRVVSEDNGATWETLPTVLVPRVAMPFTGFMPLKDGRVAVFGQQRSDPAVETDRPQDDQGIIMLTSPDGGLTWSTPRLIASFPEKNLCEPFALRSDDGKEICVLMRENRHKGNSMMCFSDDEGQTWSRPVDTPWGLTGDRHEGIRVPDGRWVIAFRDQAIGSPTRGHFVAWVGTYAALKNGTTEGTYRVKLLHSYGGADCGYPGVECLPDGTIVATTYIKYWKDDRKSSVVSTRFKLSETDALLRKTLWTAGDGFASYRIPALVVSSKGTILAFCEARGKASDTGFINTVLRRSTDNGQTWSPQQIVWSDGANTCGNPVPVLDRKTGRILLALTWNLGTDSEGAIIKHKSKDTRRVFITYSDDDGVTWAKPQDTTATTKKPDWGWYATGPGGGIQLMHGKHAGRIIIPCDHSDADGAYRSHVIFSDDGGTTWALGGTVPTTGLNECQAVELADGKILLNMRNYERKQFKTRRVSVSDDGGATWGEPTFDRTLIEPVCEAAIQRVRWPDAGKAGLVAFLNPANEKSRSNLTLRFSVDDCASWRDSVVLFAGPSAYSDLAALPDGSVGALFECGARDAYDCIRFRIVPVE